MNANIKQLYHKSQKETKRIIGLMSGTSLDGLDIAVCDIKNSGFETACTLTAFKTVAYDTDFKSQISEVFSKEHVSLEKLCVLNPWIANIHAQMILKALSEWNIAPESVDFIASHGQTIYHAPYSLHGDDRFPNATLQIGDGDHLAHNTGIITISDFRQKQLAAGGEGAPLALYGDFLLCRDQKHPRILLNIGGISNFTYIPNNASLSEVLCSDTGTGNTLMDAYVQRYFNIPYDKDAAIAKTGKCNTSLLNELLKDTYFNLKLPKTTGPERFNLDYLEKAQKVSNTTKIPQEDVLRTLASFTTKTIANCLQNHIDFKPETEVYVSGGGASNPLVLELLKNEFANCSVQDTEALGINPDAKEAILFAILANQSVSKETPVTGSIEYPWVSMGKISFPG